MKVLYHFLRLIGWINDQAAKILSFFIIIIFGLLIMEVVRRYLLNAPTVWANELTQMLFGAYIVLAGGYILATEGHVNVDILYSRLSRKKQAIVDIITSVLFFLFCMMMVYYGGSLAWESLSTFEHSQSAWNPPIYPVKLTIPLGAGLLLLQGIAKLIRDILFLITGVDYRKEVSQDKETL